MAVDDKLVGMAPVLERHGQVPGSVHVTGHGMAGGVPVVEVADQRYLARLRGEADEVDGLHRGARLEALAWGDRGSRSWRHSFFLRG